MPVDAPLPPPPSVGLFNSLTGGGGRENDHNLFINQIGYGVQAPAEMNLENIHTRKRDRDQSQFDDSYDGSDLISLLIRQQQIEIDGIIEQQAKKLRMEIEARRIQQTMMLIYSVRDRVLKRMQDKDEEIQRIGRNNQFLRDNLNILSAENQWLRDLALKNEAAAASLRRNLAQALAKHRSGERLTDHEEDIASCSYNGGDSGKDSYGGDNGGYLSEKYKCKRCGEREASVLLLPCRHLCQCTVCGSTWLPTCPVCNSQTEASIRVNMS